MKPRTTGRRSDTAGHNFAILMLAVVFFLVLLMWYFKSHEHGQPLPQRPPEILHGI